MSEGIRTEELNALLAERIEPLARELFPAARRQGNELCIGGLGGEKGQSLRIHVGGGSRRGWWKDFAGTDGGRPLALIAEALFGGDYKRAYPWARSWLGLDNADPERFEQVRREARAAADKREEQADREAESKRKKAHAIWLEARPLERGDPVDRYLLRRAIDLGALGHPPGVLRFHPALPYWIYDEDTRRFRELAKLPAMVAAVTRLHDGRFLACHRTWLKPDASGKAGVEELGLDHRGRARDAKKVLGSYEGGHIKLWLGRKLDGSRVRGPLRDMPGGTLHLSEGIEDGLTAACAASELVVAAMIALGNLTEIALPEQVERVVMLKQNDPPGSKADKAYRRGVERLREDGRRVLEVPVPADCKDINDLARAG